MGGALVGGLLASVPGVALANHKPRHRGGGGASCPSGIRCKRRCCPVEASCVGSGRNRACACPQGQTDCGGQCRDLATDAANCGACGSACATGGSCVGGQCQCPVGTTLCPANNSCVQDCPPGQTLDATSCRCENAGCPGGQELCNGQCVSTGCPSGQAFDPASCRCESDGGGGGCQEGTTPCGGECVQNCPSGQVLNTTTCACEPEGLCFDCSPNGNERSFRNPATGQCQCQPGLESCSGFEGSPCCEPGFICCYAEVPGGGGAAFAGCCPSGTGCDTSGVTFPGTCPQVSGALVCA